jgi:hypothetical protein
MKTGSDARGITKNKSGSAKLENGTRCSRFRGKRLREQKNMKTEPDALGTAENESGRAKLENGSGRTRYRRK